MPTTTKQRWLATPAAAHVARAGALRSGRLLADALCAGVLLRLGQKKAMVGASAAQYQHLRHALLHVGRKLATRQGAVQLGIVSAAAVPADGALAAETGRYGCLARHAASEENARCPPVIVA